MSWMYAYAGLQAVNTISNFAMGRKQNKQYLQKLHQDRLLTKLTTISNTNTILDQMAEEEANNITINSNAGFDGFDSGSFKAIHKRTETAGRKDISNVEMSNAIALEGINGSIKNLNFNMRMNELMLATDLGSLAYSTNNYMKDQTVLEGAKNTQLKELEKLNAETKKATTRMKDYYQSSIRKNASIRKNELRYQMGTLNFGVNQRRVK